MLIFSKVLGLTRPAVLLGIARKVRALYNSEHSMQIWPLREAKIRFSALMEQVVNHGPQEITDHGRPVAVVLSREEFDRLSGNAVSLVEFMQQSPLFDREDIQLERDSSFPSGGDGAATRFVAGDAQHGRF